MRKKCDVQDRLFVYYFYLHTDEKHLGLDKVINKYVYLANVFTGKRLFPRGQDFLSKSLNMRLALSKNNYIDKNVDTSKTHS